MQEQEGKNPPISDTPTPPSWSAQQSGRRMETTLTRVSIPSLAAAGHTASRTPALSMPRECCKTLGRAAKVLGEDAEKLHMSLLEKYMEVLPNQLHIWEYHMRNIMKLGKHGEVSERKWAFVITRYSGCFCVIQSLQVALCTCKIPLSRGENTDKHTG